MAESFITVLNGVITGKHHGDMNTELYGTLYYGHEKIAVPYDTAVVPLEPVKFYTSDWQRKSDCCLIDEGLLPMPEGYVREGGELRPMTADERVIAGIEQPQPGYKIVKGQIVPMTLKEQLTAGQITQEVYEAHMAAENTGELQRRLAELQTPEALAQAEVDEEYAAARKKNLTALLAVKKQPSWPVTVKWPE
jgi:hypothetical protein